MAIIEILNYGKLPGSPAAPAGILSRSSGINQDLADEIVRLCKGWGNASVLGDSQSALMSFPLKARAKFAAKGAYAVIKVLGGVDPLFQAAVLNRPDYAAFGFNPFAVVEAGAFPQWDSSAVPGRRSLKPGKDSLIISPPPSPEDVGMIDEALHQLLAAHKLYLPVEKPTAESDRCLALLIEVLPEALKQQLRFASFAPSAANGYHLAATETIGCDFAGWQRLMMTLVGGVLPENLDRYVKKVRDCLAFGDIGVIRDESRILALGRQNAEPQHKPAARPRTPVLTPVVAAVQKSPKTAQRQAVKRNGDGRVRSKTSLGQLRGGRRQLPGAVIGLLVLVMTAAGGWTYLELFNGGTSIPWNELVAWPGQGPQEQKNQVASLLEVPNVGSVYHKQIKKIHRAGMIPGLNQETDQRRGVINLKKEAAIPLLAQVDLYLDLSEAGIRQGSRPDRESQRLQALSNQGRVLNVEMSRLELAWHSLSTGVNWNDLNDLTDTAVVSRRDSLRKAQPSALRAAAADMEFGSRREKLDVAVRQVHGMSQLLVLFQAPHWSDQWNRDLYRAAEMVSPSASAITRAYRNSAFTFIRLKNAEHTADFTEGPFLDNLENNVWPGEKVADILPRLRREAGKFSGNETPELLSGTLQIYTALEGCTALVKDLARGSRSLAELENNPAVLFDPEAYVNYLERLRFQAALKNPELYQAEYQDELQVFASMRLVSTSEKQWDEEILQLKNPFLKRWARYEKLQTQQALLADLSEFDTAWDQVEKLVKQLENQGQGGSDWTATWVDLNQLVQVSLQEAAELLQADPAMASRLGDLKKINKWMSGGRTLQLEKATVRLDQNILVGPENIVVEFQVLPMGEILKSASFIIGPAAPEGSGWVGTANFTAAVDLDPTQEFQVTVRSKSDGRELLKVHYPSLSQRVGPGALARPRPGANGTLLIKTDDSWWREIGNSPETIFKAQVKVRNIIPGGA